MGCVYAYTSNVTLVPDEWIKLTICVTCESRWYLGTPSARGITPSSLFQDAATNPFHGSALKVTHARHPATLIVSPVLLCLGTRRSSSALETAETRCLANIRPVLSGIGSEAKDSAGQTWPVHDGRLEAGSRSDERCVRLAAGFLAGLDGTSPDLFRTPRLWANS